MTSSVVITYNPAAPQAAAAIEAVKSHLAGMPVRLSIEHLRQSNSSLSDRLEIPEHSLPRDTQSGLFRLSSAPMVTSWCSLPSPKGALR